LFLAQELYIFTPFILCLLNTFETHLASGSLGVLMPKLYAMHWQLRSGSSRSTNLSGNCSA